MTALANDNVDRSACRRRRDAAAFHRSLAAATSPRPCVLSTTLRTSSIFAPCSSRTSRTGWDFPRSRSSARRGRSKSRCVASRSAHARGCQCREPRPRVAHVAGRRGSCRVYLPARSVRARREAIAAEGADVVVVDGTYEDAVRLAAAAGAEPSVLEIADVGSSGPARSVIDGYATLFDEAAGRAAFDLIVVPAGVGSLAAAAARHGAAGVAVVAVEPETARASRRRRGGASRPRSDAGHDDGGLDCARSRKPRGRCSEPASLGRSRSRTSRRTMRCASSHARALRIGASGAAPLAALRTLVLEESSALRRAVGLGPATRVLLIATEGPTDRTPTVESCPRSCKGPRGRDPEKVSAPRMRLYRRRRRCRRLATCSLAPPGRLAPRGRLATCGLAPPGRLAPRRCLAACGLAAGRLAPRRCLAACGLAAGRLAPRGRLAAGRLAPRGGLAAGRLAPGGGLAAGRLAPGGGLAAGRLAPRRRLAACCLAPGGGLAAGRLAAAVVLRPVVLRRAVVLRLVVLRRAVVLRPVVLRPVVLRPVVLRRAVVLRADVFRLLVLRRAVVLRAGAAVSAVGPSSSYDVAAIIPAVPPSPPATDCVGAGVAHAASPASAGASRPPRVSRIVEQRRPPLAESSW